MTIYNDTITDDILFVERWGNFVEDGPFGSYEEAAIYFADRLVNKSWEKATIKQRNAALLEASNLIRLLPLNEDYTYDTLPNSFNYGVYEQAYALLSGKNIDDEIKSAQIIRDKWGPIESYYVGDQIPLALFNGIISHKAWIYLRPYLANSEEVNLTRVN